MYCVSQNLFRVLTHCVRDECALTDQNKQPNEVPNHQHFRVGVLDYVSLNKRFLLLLLVKLFFKLPLNFLLLQIVFHNMQLKFQVILPIIIQCTYPYSKNGFIIPK